MDKKDKRTKGQEDKGTRGQENKRTRGQEEKRTRGQEDKRTKGQNISLKKYLKCCILGTCTFLLGSYLLQAKRTISIKKKYMGRLF